MDCIIPQQNALLEYDSRPVGMRGCPSLCMLAEDCPQFLALEVRRIVYFHGATLGDNISSGIRALGLSKAQTLGTLNMLCDNIIENVPSTIVQPLRLPERNEPFQST